MGIKSAFQRNDAESLDEGLTQTMGFLHDPDIQNQMVVLLTFISCITALRYLGVQRLSLLRGEHILNVKYLNEANLYKEVFLAYLNAALLEPVLAIGGMEEVVGEELVISILTLVSICWWIWLVTDAFDFSDVMQHYKFHVDIAKELRTTETPSLKWVRLVNKDNAGEKESLVGCLQKDVALWFMLSCIGAAWMPGVVSHRNVMHAYVVVILWILLHHSCRRATTWSGGYFVTFLFPSAALMPLEYCLPIMDVADCVTDLEFLISYREYVQDRTGVELIIET
mmetsp:Transcript_16917/g.20101  ORF Transcript_16917/g.20101 Transcript_16917/m.20101 type:complete len:282 (-) Transcript_16917:485-1330(-)